MLTCLCLLWWVFFKGPDSPWEVTGAFYICGFWPIPVMSKSRLVMMGSSVMARRWVGRSGVCEMVWKPGPPTSSSTPEVPLLCTLVGAPRAAGRGKAAEELSSVRTFRDSKGLSCNWPQIWPWWNETSDQKLPEGLNKKQMMGQYQ